MSKFLKLEEFTKEDLLKQLEEGKIDTNFLLDYIIKRDEVYNKLIDRINELEERQDKALEYCRGRLGFLENCCGGNEIEIRACLSIHNEYLKILSRYGNFN